MAAPVEGEHNQSLPKMLHLLSVIEPADGSKMSLKALSETKTEQKQGTILVEAGGIEPPSEDLQELATTRLFRALELALRTPTNRLSQSQPI